MSNLKLKAKPEESGEDCDTPTKDKLPRIRGLPSARDISGE